MPSTSRFRKVSTDDKGAAGAVRRSGSAEALSEVAAGAAAGQAGARPKIQTSASCPDLPHGDEAERGAAGMAVTASSSLGGPASSIAVAPRTRAETVSGAPSRFRKKAHVSTESSKVAKLASIPAVRPVTSTGMRGDEATREVVKILERCDMRQQQLEDAAKALNSTVRGCAVLLAAAAAARSVIAALFIARRFHRFASLPSPVRSFVISLCSDRARRC